MEKRNLGEGKGRGLGGGWDTACRITLDETGRSVNGVLPLEAGGAPGMGSDWDAWEIIITTEQLLRGAAHQKATPTFPAQCFSWEGGTHRR